MIEKIKNNILTFIMFLIVMVFFFAGCHHHGGGGGTPPPSTQNPASYTYTATVVATHQPGFFSCWNPGQLALGTYMDYNHKDEMQAQLCKLVDNKIVKVRTFRGCESLYNLRPIDATSLFVPGEQGGLYGADLNGHSWTIHPKHLHMGHYQAQWWHHDGISEWVTTEKDTIHSSNKSQLWVGSKLLFESSDFTWKEFVIKKDTAYLAVYFIWGHKEGGLLTVNLKTGEPNLVYSEPDCACYCDGMYKGEVYYGLEFSDGSTKIFKYPHTYIQTIPDIAWRMREIDDTFGLTAAEHGWRKAGPSYLYIMDVSTGKFIKKLQLDCCEPWDICKGPAGNQYYLASRCEKGNVGKVFLIERH